MPPASDPMLLRSYHAARTRGDAAAVSDAWQRLAINNADRIKLFRFLPAGTPIPRGDVEDAAQEAFIRVMAMGKDFKHHALGGYYAALRTCVENTCRDFGRKELRHDRRKGGSLDATYEPDGEAGPYDAALAVYDRERREIEQDAAEAEEHAAEVAELVRWGIGRVRNDNYREALQLLYLERLPAETVAERLAISMENVYARRSRGTKELKGILRDHRS